jgi:hypothetical protein
VSRLHSSLSLTAVSVGCAREQSWEGFSFVSPSESDAARDANAVRLRAELERDDGQYLYKGKSSAAPAPLCLLGSHAVCVFVCVCMYLWVCLWFQLRLMRPIGSA